MNRQERINEALDRAAEKLKEEGVKYFLSAVDRNPNDPGGGKAYATADITGDDMQHILRMALPTRGDLVNLAIWIGKLLTNQKPKNG